MFKKIYHVSGRTHTETVASKNRISNESGSIPTPTRMCLRDLFRCTQTENICCCIQTGKRQPLARYPSIDKNPTPTSCRVVFFCNHRHLVAADHFQVFQHLVGLLLKVVNLVQFLGHTLGIRELDLGGGRFNRFSKKFFDAVLESLSFSKQCGGCCSAVGRLRSKGVPDGDECQYQEKGKNGRLHLVVYCSFLKDK